MFVRRHCAVGLGFAGLDETVFDLVIGTHLPEQVVAGGLALSGRTEPIGELFAVVGEHLTNFERGLIDQALEKAFGGLG